MNTFDIRESQNAALLQMLHLNSPTSSNGGSTAFGASSNPIVLDGPTWKILIYDDTGRDIIAPNLKVGNLRQHGVTLHLPLLSERTAVREVPAVYFIAATPSNIDCLCKDFSKDLYESYYINFTTFISNDLLETLAKGAVVANAVDKVIRVVDRYLGFVSLSPHEYSLNLKNGYSMLHGNLPDVQIEGFIDSIVDGLLSVISTLDIAPIIRCPSHQYCSANMIAKKLGRRLESFQHKDDLPKSFVHESENRPILILLDRDFDLSVMLLHTWTYQALVHDIFGLRLGRVTVPIETPGQSTGSAATSKAYDLDSTDAFWKQFRDSPFPQAAAAISDALAQYNAKMRELKLQPGEKEASSTAGFASAVDALPELAERKRSIDMHTNIATALVSEIKKRELDKYFEVENEFESGADRSCLSRLESVITNATSSTLQDKTRAFLCLCLYKQHLQPTQLKSIHSKLQEEGWDSAALNYFTLLQKYKKLGDDISTNLNGITTSTSSSNIIGNVPTPAVSLLSSNAAAALEGLGTRVFTKGRDILQDVKSLLPIRSNLPITKCVEALMEQKQNALTESFLYIDPKTNQLGTKVAPRIRSSFKNCIVFVVGGGNFVESRAMTQLAKKYQKHILYGSTDFVSPCAFLQELSSLGGSIKS